MYNRILVPLDGSKNAECTLGHVKDIASGCGVSEVVLLTVTEPVMLGGIYWVASQAQATQGIVEANKTRDMILAKANEYLKKVSGDLGKGNLNIQTTVIEEQQNQTPAEVILDYADHNKVDLIVIATHGRSGVTRWAFGSVAERVIRHTLIPVLTVTPAGCRAG